MLFLVVDFKFPVLMKNDNPQRYKKRLNSLTILNLGLNRERGFCLSQEKPSRLAPNSLVIPKYKPDKPNARKWNVRGNNYVYLPSRRFKSSKTKRLFSEI
jgi:hypothetical protein